MIAASFQSKILLTLKRCEWTVTRGREFFATVDCSGWTDSLAAADEINDGWWWNPSHARLCPARLGLAGVYRSMCCLIKHSNRVPTGIQLYYYIMNYFLIGIRQRNQTGEKWMEFINSLLLRLLGGRPDAVEINYWVSSTMQHECYTTHNGSFTCEFTVCVRGGILFNVKH